MQRLQVCFNFDFLKPNRQYELSDGLFSMVPCLIIIGILAVSQSRSDKYRTTLITNLISKRDGGCKEGVLIFVFRKKFCISAFGLLKIGFGMMTSVSLLDQIYQIITL